MKKIFFALTTLFYLPLTGGVEGSFLFAQRPQTSSSLLLPAVKGATAVSYQTSGNLSEYITPAKPVKWGMDTAWIWDINDIRGANFIGKDILANGIGRVSFQTTDLVDANGELSAAQKSTLDTRLKNIELTGAKNINLNSDQEVYCGVSSYVANYQNKPQNWYNVIKATVKYCRSKGFNVVSISPFNEPDYAGWKQGTQASFKEVCRLITEDPDLAGIELCGGNTLNDDQALSWYNYNKEYLKKGNTHQLAGSMANYTKFWETVASDGNTGVADELHNCMEAFIAFHHGASEGIWWGWEGAARGVLCNATTYGKEIGYAENSDAWSGAAIYKWNRPTATGTSQECIDGFLGCSERQAKPSTFDLISTDRPAYYNGYGPVYSYSQYITADANGTYQSDNQKNAECMIDIQYGEDVPLDYPRSGNFILMNMNSSKCLAYGTSNSTIYQSGITKYIKISSNKKLYWTVEPVAEDCGGDFGYCTLRTPGSSDGKHLTTSEEWGLEAGKNIKYDANWASAGRDYWSFEYAGNNSWYIRNKYTGLYLQPKNAATSAGSSYVITMEAFTGNPEQKWRFIPVTDNMLSGGFALEQTAPAKPEGLTATPQSGSVMLSWTKGADTDLAGYNILRATVTSGSALSDSANGPVLSSSAAELDQVKWDMIGRIDTTTTFLDNDITPGSTYLYKIKAVDIARNQSLSSDSIAVTTKNAHALVAHYSFDSSANDTTENSLDIAMTGTVAYKKYLSEAKEGTNAMYLDGTTTLGVLPPSVGNMSEMTIAMWICNQSSTKSWTRLFDFGNDQTHYFFLTPNNGSEARLVFKNGGDEQILSTSKIGYGWHYIAVTLAKDSVTLYVDDKAVTSKSITIRPSDFMPRRNYLGCSQFSADPLFKGYIDDLRIYNYALSASEVEALKTGKQLTNCDVNNDGKVDIDDVKAIVSVICGDETYKDTADVNLDGKVDVLDVNNVISVICNS